MDARRGAGGAEGEGPTKAKVTIPLSKGRKIFPKDYAEIKRLLLSGEHSLRSVGDRYGVSRERIRQIALALSIPPRRPPQLASLPIRRGLRAAGIAASPLGACFLCGRAVTLQPPVNPLVPRAYCPSCRRLRKEHDGLRYALRRRVAAVLLGVPGTCAVCGHRMKARKGRLCQAHGDQLVKRVSAAATFIRRHPKFDWARILRGQPPGAPRPASTPAAPGISRRVR